MSDLVCPNCGARGVSVRQDPRIDVAWHFTPEGHALRKDGTMACPNEESDDDIDGASTR